MPKLLGAVVMCLVVLAGFACAEDWNDYPQLRHVSGLPGGAAPVNEDGQLQFGGAFHINIPCAYTPSRDNYSVMLASGSREDNEIHLGFRGHQVDGSVHAVIGFGEPGRGLCVAGIFVDEDWRNTINVQYQVSQEDGDQPAVAIGVLDIFDQQVKRINIDGGARSFYVTATRRLTESARPLYGTLGLGDGRFNGIFGGVSWYPEEKVNVGFEYDGRVPRLHAGFQAYASERVEGVLWGGWTNFERPVFGLSVQYHP